VRCVDDRGSIHLEGVIIEEAAMQVAFEPKGPILLVRILETQIGADTADGFRSKVLGLMPREGARIALDLTRVGFLDSSGLGALVSLLKTVRPTGELVLFGLKPSVQEILRLTHLDSVFVSAPNEEAALAMFSKAATA
jgi:anti-sigma B factor antagonist